MTFQEQLRSTLQKNRFEWRKHALERMSERGITQAAALEALFSGEQIEAYTSSTPYPSALFLSFRGSKPLHVVAALDTENDWAYIITVYEPDLEHFEPDYKTRKK